MMAPGFARNETHGGQDHVIIGLIAQHRNLFIGTKTIAGSRYRDTPVFAVNSPSKMPGGGIIALPKKFGRRFVCLVQSSICRLL